ncbi:MAG: type VI secretion system tip protein VgrG, partial [Zoogloeaceae bacterium]|nr:type VI secretion system tip protein VgrG [Zoogloeaceae bacterium]
MTFTVTVSSPAMPSLPLEFFRMSGEESLSALYKYVFVLKTPSDSYIGRHEAANVNYKQLIGKEFTAHIELSDLGRREISGLVTKARIVESNDQQSIYEIEIEPWLVLATRTSDYKRYQEKTVVQIIDEVLSDYNFPVKKRLSGRYPVLGYQVQYGETDFAFIQRLMEEWGIYWYFEHSKGAHHLVLIDDMAAHGKAPHAKVLYNPEGKIDEEHLSVFSAEEKHRPGRWVTNDFDFEKPLADLEVSDPKPRKTGFPNEELYEWPGDYTDAALGKRLAEVRMHAAGVSGSLATGSGNVRGLPCGYTFHLEGYPAEKANREYLVASAYLALTEKGRTTGQAEYSCQGAFTFFPTDKVFR